MPWWSAFRDEPLQISVGTSGQGPSDATGLVVESDSDVTGAIMQHPVYSACPIRTEDAVTGRPECHAAPHLSTGYTYSFEIPETPPMPEKIRCPVNPSVVRVLGKRLHAERPQYLVLCWMYPLESEAADSDLDHRFREYDEKISRNLVQQERLSTLRSRKRRRTHATASASQNSTYPSR